ncbi:hypothetical protein CROQUDRAFT_666985 [Cronartium quercuum f. sp. fusiforme G11]|uniref:Uncharacterized protein n=1 Tax=Cronartium quercuum f. sp. fusiforme G11 TaxID=708437 RepID=A0A9P6N4U5_9BASI|nr:hypothetical protein CROQUDRAFT_666985 [Cronartium quercuum f. sp. fusiforme G11]
MVELSRVDVHVKWLWSGLVVDWSEKLREAGSVDYSEKNLRINYKNPVESGKTGFSEVGKNPTKTGF